MQGIQVQSDETWLCSRLALVLRFPFLPDLLRSTRLAVLLGVFLGDGGNLRVLSIEVLLQFRKVFFWDSDQSAFLEGGLALLLGGEVVHERWRVFAADCCTPSGSCRCPIQLHYHGRFELARKFLEQARRFLPICCGLARIKPLR